MKKSILVLAVSIFSISSFTSCVDQSDLTPSSTTNVSSTTNTSGTSSLPRLTSSVVCIGTTKAGNRCQNRTLSPNHKCHVHGGN